MFIDITIIPPLNPVLPSQMTPQPTSGMGNQTALPVVVRNPLEAVRSNTLIGRLIMPMAQQGNPRFDESFLKAARVLAALNPMRPMANLQPNQGTQRAIVVQRDEVTAKEDKNTGGELVNLQVFEVENEGLSNKDQKQQPAFQQPERPAEKEPSTQTGHKFVERALNPEKNQHKAHVDTSKNVQLKNVSKDEASKNGNEGTTKSKLAAEQTLPRREASKVVEKEIKENKNTSRKEESRQDQPRSSVRRERSTPNESPQRLPSSSAKEKSFTHKVVENSQPSESSDVEKIREKVKDKDKEVDNVKIDMSHGSHKKHTIDQQANTQATVVHSQHKQLPLPTNDIQLIGWIGLLPLQQQQEELKARREGKSAHKTTAAGHIEYRFSDLLFVILAATIAGANTLVEIIQFYESRENWLKHVLGAAFSIPPRELIWRLLSNLNTSTFSEVLVFWLQEICGHQPILKGLNGKPILPAISIWSTPTGIIIGQANGSDKSLGRYAIAQLMQIFTFDSTIILSSVPDAKTDLARYIERARGKYIVEIDPSSRSAEVMDTLVQDEEHLSSQGRCRIAESYVEGQDRLKVYEIHLNALPEGLNALTVSRVATILQLHCEAIVRGVSIESEFYYISNIRDVAEDFFDLFRYQRHIEGKLKWHLNCEFPIRPFQTVMKQCNENIGLFRRFARELLRSGGGGITVEKKMEQAASDNQILLGFMNKNRCS